MSNETLTKMMHGTNQVIRAGVHLEAQDNCRLMSYVRVEIGMEKLIRNIILIQQREPIKTKKRHQIERILESFEEGQTGDQIQSQKIRTYFIIMEIDRGKLILFQPQI